MTESYTTTIGCNEIGNFVGDGELRIQFTEEQMNALIFAQVHSRALADAFANYCKMTFASGSIPTCFRQDLSPEEINEIHQELPAFAENFPCAMFNLMLIFEM